MYLLAGVWVILLDKQRAYLLVSHLIILSDHPLLLVKLSDKCQMLWYMRSSRRDSSAVLENISWKYFPLWFLLLSVRPVCSGSPRVSVMFIMFGTHSSLLLLDAAFFACMHFSYDAGPAFSYAAGLVLLPLRLAQRWTDVQGWVRRIFSRIPSHHVFVTGRTYISLYK